MVQPRGQKKTKMGEHRLKEVYFNPAHPGSFGGVDKLNRHFKNKQKIKKFLANQDAYTLHKPIRRKFTRRKTIVGGIDHQWQADLIDLQSLKKYNNGIGYILVAVDILSKYAFAIGVCDKSGKNVVKAFDRILTTSHRRPAALNTDKGREFLNSTFQNYLKKKGIRFFTSENDDVKASVAERLIRTVKGQMWRYFTYKNTFKYIDVLEDLIGAYNSTYHSSIKEKPVNVTSENQDTAWHRLYDIKLKPSTADFKIGDYVRISQTRAQFKKGYMGNWTSEIFKVRTIEHTIPTTYSLVDQNNEQLKGHFYKEELQKVNKKTVFQIEDILKRKKCGRQTKYYVKWLGYPESFNSWINEKDFINGTRTPH